MTFTHIGNGLYTCLSTDTKVTTGITTNSVAIESDTGILYVLSSGAWNSVGGGGGGGAPTTVSYLTLGTNATLTSERVLTAGTDISFTDGGAGSTLTVDIGANVITTSNTKTLTNKTIAAGSNTITGIVDANISAHTTSKITTTNKSLLNSSIVYNDQANSFGDFAQTFKDNQLKINNPADTFAYTIIGAAIAANRNITLPLLTGNDVAVTEAFTQTLTNKTLDTATNTITGIADTNITAHTSTKITITDKTHLNSSIVYTDQANSLGDFNFTLKDNRLLINNPADTFNYTIIAAAIAANRTITLPLLTGNDTMVTEAFSQTLTNKTMSGSSNTFSNIPYTALTSVPTTIVKTDQTNTFGAFDQVIPSTNLKLSNSGFNASLSVGTLGGNITITLPNTTSTLVISTDSRLSDARTPTTHASSHNAAGGDVIHIDTIGAGTDITTNNVSTSKHGLTPKLSNVATEYLNGTGGWSTPAGTGSGEANTYSSPSVGGTVIILTKSGVDLPFKGIAAASSKIAIADDSTNKNVTIDVNQANLAIAYSQLTSVPSVIVKTDQTNTYGAFNQIFPSTRLRINDSTTPANYIFATSAITADRTITLPLLTGNDTAVMEAFAQTLTNKTIAAGSNTITGIVDANITAHTTSKITTTNKSLLNTAIVYNDQANTYGSNMQTFASSNIKVMNPAGTFGYIIVGSAITTANRNITLPLLTADDTFAMLAFGQTFTNKTIDATNNTISNIGDANTATFTTTKITTSSKSLLNSAIVYNDQANVYGDFLQTIRSSRLKIMNPANTFGYIFVGSAITTADKNITIPLLTASDNMVFEAFSQTLTNKTMSGASNTFSNIPYSALTSVPTTIVKTDQTNTYGAFAQIFPSSQLKIQNPGATFNYIFAGSAIAADRTVTLPLLTGNDQVTTDAFATTLTNKTINATNNTITDTSTATGDILRSNGTKFVRKAIGTGLQVLRTNPGATDIEWASLNSENTGVATASGNASTTVFNIPHSLGSTPSVAMVICSTLTNTFTYTYDATNIVVTFTTAPASGTNNVKFNWRAVA